MGNESNLINNTDSTLDQITNIRIKPKRKDSDNDSLDKTTSNFYQLHGDIVTDDSNFAQNKSIVHFDKIGKYHTFSGHDQALNETYIRDSPIYENQIPVLNKNSDNEEAIMDNSKCVIKENTNIQQDKATTVLKQKKKKNTHTTDEHAADDAITDNQRGVIQEEAKTVRKKDKSNITRAANNINRNKDQQHNNIEISIFLFLHKCLKNTTVLTCFMYILFRIVLLKKDGGLIA